MGPGSLHFSYHPRGADAAGPQTTLGSRTKVESILKVEETEVQRGELVCPESHNMVETGPRLESRSAT